MTLLTDDPEPVVKLNHRHVCFVQKLPMGHPKRRVSNAPRLQWSSANLLAHGIGHSSSLLTDGSKTPFRVP